MSKKIIIDGVIGWDVMASSIRRELENTNEEIIIDISSPGGSVFDGIEIFNVIRDYSKNVNKVTTRIIGLAASMASYIALSGNKVIALDNAIYMIHNVWSITAGDHRELRKEADIIDNLSNLLAKEYSKKTKKELKEIRQLMDDETWIMGNDILGFADEIEKTENQNDDKQSRLMLAKGRVDSCFALMEKSERSKNDLKRAASLIMNFEQSEVKPVEKNQEETNNMDNIDIAKLNARIAELEAQNKALKGDIENITAHLEYADIAPNEVLAAIKNKEEFSAKIHSAKYAKIQIINDLKKNRAEDNPPDLNIKKETIAETEEDTNAYAAKLKARRGIK